MDLYFDDLHPGQFWTTAARTVTEDDLTTFARLTSDNHPLHTDADYARKSPFGERIAHGFLVVSLAAGLGYTLMVMEDTIIANLGTHWRFLNPVKLGDTIHVVITVGEMRRSKSNPAQGIVVRKFDVKNQRGETCALGEVSNMVKCRQAA